MVLLTRFLYSAKNIKKLPRKYLRSNFLDTLRLHLTGGAGGTGLPRYGGLGGAGGNIYLVAKEGETLETVLKKLKTKRIKADSGNDSTARGIIGLPGEDKIISVPRGITIYSQHGLLLGELDQNDSKLLVAKGGMGGCEQTGFCGLKGESHVIHLDLKLIADVGLVGFPNAGKSTLLAAISAAKPKIAAYPFTTIRPKLGIVKFEDHRTISIADLPGLIEGAHMNIGMGHQFLKHVERTKLLVFIVDIQGFRLSVRHLSRSCLETVVLLNKEIELYKPDLLNMPALIIVNKMDTKDADSIYKEIEPALQNLANFVATCSEEMRPEQVVQFEDILPVSLISKNKQKINLIKDRIRSILDKYQEQKDGIKYGDCDSQLKERIKRQITQHAPTVI